MKRSGYNKRTAKERRKNRRSAVIAMILLFSVLFIALFSMQKTTQAEDRMPLNTYYKTITIHSDDTLWNLAEQYSEGGEEDIRAYISEVKSINHMGSDKIKSGMNLIIPYYAD